MYSKHFEIVIRGPGQGIIYVIHVYSVRENSYNNGPRKKIIYLKLAIYHQ
jgi:hypothetical protein